MQLSIAGFLVVLVLATSCSASVTTLWPQPKSVKSGTEAGVVLSEATFKFSVTCESSSILSKAVERYAGAVFPYGAGGGAEHVREAAGSGFGTLTGLSVCVSSSDTTLTLGVDESYVLEVDGSGSASLKAATVFGAMYGLETFSQLVEYGYDNDTYSIAATPITIADAPRFPWRGMLVDTARHYMPATKVLSIIDTLAQNKYNVMHWHIVDAQSFPYVVAAYPKLAEAGAWHSTAIFTAAEVAQVVQHGLERGVRVVPEFDGPGHSAAWGKGYPDIVSQCPAYAANVNNLNLNPASAQTLEVLEAVYTQAAGAFSDDYMHLGGDEVVQGCWADDPQVAAWMKERHYSTLDVYQYFEDNMLAIAKSARVNKTVVLWEDPFDNGVELPRDVIIEVWRNQATLKNVTAAGFSALLAAPFYLDQQIPGNKQTFYEWEDTWKAMWAIDPVATLTPSEAARVLGGEAAMWAEQVMETNFDSRVWPRASAVAERFWSAASLINLTADTVARLNAMSCRMQVRGVGCGPIAPSFCLLPSDVQRHADL